MISVCLSKHLSVISQSGIITLMFRLSHVSGDSYYLRLPPPQILWTTLVHPRILLRLHFLFLKDIFSKLLFSLSDPSSTPTRYSDIILCPVFAHFIHFTRSIQLLNQMVPKLKCLALVCKSLLHFQVLKVFILPRSSSSFLKSFIFTVNCSPSWQNPCLLAAIECIIHDWPWI